MTRCSACAPRCLLARALSVEQLEGRWLLSTFSAPSDPQLAGFAAESSPIPVLVSAASIAAPGDPPTSDGFGEIMAADAGSSAGAVDPGITGMVSSLPNSPTTLPAVMATVPGTSTSAIQGGASGTAGVAASSFVANEAPLEPSLVTLQAIAPNLLLPGTPLIAGAGGPIAIAAGMGGSSMASGPSGFSVQVSSVASPSQQAGFVTLASTGGGGQTVSGVGGGGIVPVYVLASTTGEIRPPSGIAFNLGDPTTPESPATFAIVTTGSSHLAPPVAATADGYVGIATTGASSPGAAGNSSNAAALVGISTVSLAPSGTSQVSVNAGHLRNKDYALTLAGKWLTDIRRYRDVADPGNQGIVARAESSPQPKSQMAGQFGLAVPSPQRSDLIMDFVPLDQPAVDQTIDQFIQQFEDLGAGLSWLQGPRDVVVELLAVAVALIAWKVIPKILGRSPDDVGLAAVDVATSLDGISGLPGGARPEEP